MINLEQMRDLIDTMWDDEIVPALCDYIRIPNKSPAFEPEWEQLGHMDAAVDLLASWARSKLPLLPGARLSIERIAGRTPLILIEVPGTSKDTVLLYGHLDKQPEMTGWDEGKGPWEPVLEGERLYGRGGADDGYAMFGAIAALLALKDQSAPHARAVILIEASEESGSPDLPFHIEALADRIGDPSLIVCLDSGCGDYDRLWVTTSLRGIANGTLRVEILSEGVHSGDASGVVPSSFRIVRQLLSRIEDEDSGTILLEDLHTAIPEERLTQASAAAQALGDAVFSKFPFVEGAGPSVADGAQHVLNRTWRPALAVTGLGGAPEPDKAGNVLRPGTEVKLSMRLPPKINAETAIAVLKQRLESDPPYGARVAFIPDEPGSGWNAPATAPWLAAAIEEASINSFGTSAAMSGEGGSIPFMAMLGNKYPEAQFVITGVLGPHSNAHGPNEFLDIPTGKRVTQAIAHILHRHATRSDAR